MPTPNPQPTSEAIAAGQPAPIGNPDSFTEGKLPYDDAVIRRAVMKDFTDWTDEEQQQMRLYDRYHEWLKEHKAAKAAALRKAGQENEAAYTRNLMDYDRRMRTIEQMRQSDPVSFFMQAVAPRSFTLYTLPLTGEQATGVMREAYTRTVNQTGRGMRDPAQVVFQVDKSAHWIINSDDCRRRDGQFKNWLLLRGSVGTGKTTLLDALRLAIDTFDPSGRRIAKATASRLADLQRDNRPAFERLKQEPLLAIDDLGTEPATVKDYGNDNTPLAELLTYRYERRLFTVMTTNLDDSGLQRQYGPRVANRLKELSHSIVFGNHCYRE